MSLACPSLIGSYQPELCAAVDHYCERTGSALDAEPINALTNAAFLVAALDAWRLMSRNVSGRTTGLISALILTMALVGLGSFLFHTVATRWAEWGDVLPIMLFMLLFLWFTLTNFFAWPLWLKTLGLAAYFGATLYAEGEVPASVLWGGAMYVPTVVVMLTIVTVLRWRQIEGAGAFLFATAVFLLSFTARTLDHPLCAAFPIGTHFLWHLLNATLLYILVRTAILHTAPMAETVPRSPTSEAAVSPGPRPPTR